MSQPMTEAQILEVLRLYRFADPEFAFIPHVNEGTGAGRGRTLDAVAMGLWPSRGLHLHGIEVKAYRGDWLRERKKPAKADGWAMACHFFWVAAPEGVVCVDELPHGWGLITVSPRGTKATHTATLREAEPLTLIRIAALLRAACKIGDEVVPRAQVKEAAAAELERIKGQLEHQHGRAMESRTLHYQQLLKGADRFEKLSGIHIASCTEEHAKLAGAAVRGEYDLRQLRRKMALVRKDLTEAQAVIDRWERDCPEA